LTLTDIDTSAGVLIPHFDADTGILYAAGKGDGNIRYYEYVNDTLFALNEYKSTDPTRGLAFMPKRALDIGQNELMRAYRTVNDSHIEPLSFFAPRRVEAFQPDLYPPAPSGEPALSAAAWFSGATAAPKTINMEELYRQHGGVDIVASKPTPPTTSTQSASNATTASPQKAVAQSAPIAPVATDLDKFMASIPVTEERTTIADDNRTKEWGDGEEEDKEPNPEEPSMDDVSKKDVPPIDRFDAASPVPAAPAPVVGDGAAESSAAAAEEQPSQQPKFAALTLDLQAQLGAAVSRMDAAHKLMDEAVREVHRLQQVIAANL